MANIEPFNHGGEISRKTAREISQRQESWAIQSFEEAHKRALVEERIEAGFMMTGKSNFFIDTLSTQPYSSHESAVRCGHLVDQFAINAGHVIGQYMRGN